MASMIFNNVYINDYFVLTGPLESESKLKQIDIKVDDYYFGEKTFEQAEVKMQKMVTDFLLKRHHLSTNDIDLLVGGDLLDQISATSYAAIDNNIPFLGVYNACATFPESIIIASMFLQNKAFNNVLGITSSHNLTAERQFRYPIEYGSPKPQTSTFTVTSAISTLLTKKVGKIKIESATIGNVTEMGIKDANNMGAVMAPAAALTLFNHLNDLNRDIDYYDLILTGDLGCIGSNIFKEYTLRTYNLKIKKYLDAGCELYLNSQDVYSGGSGPACLPLVLFSKIIPSKKYKKILIIGTGALHNKTFVNQKWPIPAIAHAVSLEVL
jgi:stage V sporulation protein AD